MAELACDTIETELVGCKSVDSRKRKGAQSLFGLLVKAGFIFPDAPRGRVQTALESEIDDDGDVLGPVDVTHGLLAPEDLDDDVDGGSGTVAYLHEMKRFSLGQGAGFDSLRAVNKLARKQCEIARGLYSSLRPEYGWIDVCADEAVPVKTLRVREIAYIFWANFYGPEYVDKYGKDFFLKAPGWCKEELDDGGVLYITCKDFVEWANRNRGGSRTTSRKRRQEFVCLVPSTPFGRLNRAGA